MQENELRMLSTDTNTISTTFPSPPFPSLHPRDAGISHTNHCWGHPPAPGQPRSGCSLGKAAPALPGMPVLSLPAARMRTPLTPLCWETASIPSAPSTCSAQSTALGWVLSWSHPGSCSRSPEHSCSLQSPIKAHSLPQTFS